MAPVRLIAGTGSPRTGSARFWRAATNLLQVSQGSRGLGRLSGFVENRQKWDDRSCRGTPGEAFGAPGRPSGGGYGPDPRRATLEEWRTSRPISSKVLGGSPGALLGGTSISAENGYSGNFDGPGGPDTGPPGVEPVGPEVWHTSQPNRTLRKAFRLRACPCNS